MAQVYQRPGGRPATSKETSATPWDRTGVLGDSRALDRRLPHGAMSHQPLGLVGCPVPEALLSQWFRAGGSSTSVPAQDVVVRVAHASGSLHVGRLTRGRFTRGGFVVGWVVGRG